MSNSFTAPGVHLSVEPFATPTVVLGCSYLDNPLLHPESALSKAYDLTGMLAPSVSPAPRKAAPSAWPALPPAPSCTSHSKAQKSGQQRYVSVWETSDEDSDVEFEQVSTFDMALDDMTLNVANPWLPLGDAKERADRPNVGIDILPTTCPGGLAIPHAGFQPSLPIAVPRTKSRPSLAAVEGDLPMVPMRRTEGQRGRSRTKAKEPAALRRGMASRGPRERKVRPSKPAAAPVKPSSSFILFPANNPPKRVTTGFDVPDLDRIPDAETPSVTPLAIDDAVAAKPVSALALDKALWQLYQAQMASPTSTLSSASAWSPLPRAPPCESYLAAVGIASQDYSTSPAIGLGLDLGAVPALFRRHPSALAVPSSRWASASDLTNLSASHAVEGQSPCSPPPQIDTKWFPLKHRTQGLVCRYERREKDERGFLLPPAIEHVQDEIRKRARARLMDDFRRKIAGVQALLERGRGASAPNLAISRE